MILFFPYRENVFFFHSPMTQKHLKDSSSELKKKRGRNFTFWQRCRMEIFDSKQDLKKKNNYKKHVKTRGYNGNYFHSQL